MLGVWAIVCGASAATVQVGPGGFATVQEGVDAAADGDTVLIAAGTYEGSVRLRGRTLELVGPDGAAATVLTASLPAPTDATVMIDERAEITLRGLTVDGRGVQGALFVLSASVIAEDVVLSGPAPDVGRELTLYDGDGTFTRLTVVDPVVHPTLTGGHADLESATVAFVDSTFANGQTVDGIGGAIYTWDTALTLQGCTFTDNGAAEGGALFLEARPINLVSIEGTTFERNAASSGPGGAVIMTDGQLVVSETTFRDGSATDVGGCLTHIAGKVLELADVTFEGCSSEVAGGAVAALDGGTLTATRTQFLDSSAVGAGGGLLVQAQTGAVDVSGATFCGNTAGVGGAVQLSASTTEPVTLRQSVFVGNAAQSGGAIAVLGDGEAQVSHVTVVDSESFLSEGALFATAGAVVRRNGSAWTHNQGVAVYSVPPASADGGYNLYFQNDANLGTPAGTADEGTWSDVRDDPRYRGYLPGDCTSDLRPAPNSPMVDGADPVELDDDGTRADIGAFGGAGAAQLWDLDGDGVIVDDCAPYDPDSVSATDEIPNDGIDQDCDGLDLCFVDADGDGVGTDQTTPGPLGCAGEGVANTTGDCDDTDPALAADCEPPDETGGDTEPAPEAGPDLRPAWFCSSVGARPVGPLALVLVGIVARRRKR